MKRPTWPFSPISCREGWCERAVGDAVCLNPGCSLNLRLKKPFFRNLLLLLLLFFPRICTDWKSVWSFSSKQIGCQRQPFWREHICPAMCRGEVVSVLVHASSVSASAFTPLGACACVFMLISRSLGWRVLSQISVRGPQKISNYLWWKWNV